MADTGRGKHLEHYGGAGDGDHGTEPDRFAHRHSERGGGSSGSEPAGEQDLDRSSYQGDAADGLEVAKGALEAKREQKKRDANFCQELDFMSLDYSRAGGVGPHEDPGCDIADHEGKAEGARGEAAEQAGQNDPR